jgi:hypothetical protein
MVTNKLTAQITKQISGICQIIMGKHIDTQIDAFADSGIDLGLPLAGAVYTAK